MGKIFISYRRKDAHFAHRLAEKLQSKVQGFIFIDRKIDEADFEQALLRQISECNVFVLVVTERTFDPERIWQDDDWIRREVAEALRLQKPIALACCDGHYPPTGDVLPENIRTVARAQGIPFDVDHFEEDVDRLVKHCIGISHGGLEPVPESLRELPLSPSGLKNVSVKGNNNITFADSPHASVSVDTQATRRATEVIRKDQLTKEREQIARNIVDLQEKLQGKQRTLEGKLAYYVGFAILILLAFSIDTLIGIMALIGLAVFAYFSLGGGNSARSELERKLQEQYRRLADLNQQIEKQ